MPTLIDVAKQFKQCDNATVKTIYTLISLRLKEIQRQIRKHEREFSTFLIKENPVASMITLAKTEIDALQRLPENCFKIKTQVLDLSARLAQFRDCIATAFCKTPHHAYDWMANNIITALLKEIRRDVNDPELRAEISYQFTKLYEELVQDAVRTSLLNNVQQDTAMVQSQEQIKKEYDQIPEPPRKRVA